MRRESKQAIALELFERCRRDDEGVVSTQILQEYFVTATRKLGVPAENARRKVEILSRLHLVSIGAADVLAAIDQHQQHQLAFWDALVVRAALQAGCSVLYSEDMQHGRRFGDLRIIDPCV